MARATMDPRFAPEEIGRWGEHDVKIRWRDGAEHRYPARVLRLNCPCALCVDEWSGEKRVSDASLPAGIIPLKIELVGGYAITIVWSDGHSTGIYPFVMLREMGEALAQESA